MTESSPPSQPQDPAPAAPPEAKKGLSPLAWVLIILGVVFVLMMGACVACGLVVTQAARELASDFEANPAKAMAELAVRANPDIELVESDDDAGTMTVRNTETGEELTLNFEDITEGRFSITTDEGGVSFDTDADGGGITATGVDGSVSRIGALGGEDLPEWLDPYPAGTIAPGGFRGVTADGVAGAFQMSTDDACSEVNGLLHRGPAGGGISYRRVLGIRRRCCQLRSDGHAAGGDGRSGALGHGHHDRRGRWRLRDQHPVRRRSLGSRSLRVAVLSDRGSARRAVG